MAAVNQEELLGQLIPDVYIRKITLESTGTTLVENNPHIDHERESLPRKDPEDKDSLVVNVELLMKEKLDNDLIGTWFANQDLNKYLQIKLFQSTDPKTTALLSAGSDLLDLVDEGKAVPTEDIRMKLAATVFQVRSAQEVYERLDKRVSFRKIAASKTGTGVEPKLTNYKETVDDDGNRVFDVMFRQRFELPRSRPEHLAYFAMTSLDLEELARDFDLDLDAVGLKKMNGRIASELVIDDFEIINKSFVFLDPEGKIWAGAVHRMPNGQFRSGANETPNSVDLNRFPVSNTKLQDFRDAKEIEKLMIDFSTIENNFLNKNSTKILTNDRVDSERSPVYFSEMLLSRDKDGDAKFFFSVDFSKMIEENAVFGRLFANANERLKMEMLRNTHIRSLRVLRRRIKENTSLNKLGSPHGVTVFDKNEPMDLVAVSNEKSWKRFAKVGLSTGTVREVDLVMDEESPMVRHFTGMDLTMSDLTDGLYQYVVELEVNDATVDFLVRKIEDLLRAKSVLESYLSEGSKPSMTRYLQEIRDPHIEHPSEFAGTRGENSGTFDVASNRFTQNFIDQQRSKYNGKRLRFAPWIAPVAVYADVLDLFTDAFSNRRERQKFLKSLYSYTSPNTGNPTGISMVINLIDSLITSLSKIAGVTVTTSKRRYDGLSVSTIQSPITNSSRSTKKTFKVTKAFDEFFDSEVVKGVGMDYLSKGEDETENEDGLRTIRNDDYQGRVDLETLKYFKSPTPNIDMSFGGEQFTERDNIRATSFSFLSPSRVDFMKKSVILSEGGKTVNSKDNLEPGEEGQRIPTRGFRKSKKNRFIEHIDNGEVDREDVATEICSSILFTNSLKSPGACRINRSIGSGKGKGRRANKGKKLNDKVKINEETVKRTFDNFFADQGSMTSRPVRVKVKKDPLDDLVVLEPVRPRPRPEISFDCVEPEDDPELQLKSQEEEDFFIFNAETLPLNQFYLSLAAPIAQRGSSNVKRLFRPNLQKRKGTLTVQKRRIPSLVSSLNIQNLRVVSTAGRSDALRTIHGLNSVVTENQIKRLPNQLKALLLQSASQNVVRPTKLKGVGATEKTEKQKYAASLTLDFEMLRQIEYFAGYEKSEEGGTMIKKPVWKLLTDERNNELIGKDILCRMVPYENTQLGILPNKGMETAVYDEYFILQPKFKEPQEQEDTLVRPSVVRNEIASSIIGDLTLNFPSVQVARVPTPPPISNVNEEEEDDSVRILPIGLKIIEVLESGKERETRLELRDTDKFLDFPGRSRFRDRSKGDTEEVKLGAREEEADVKAMIAIELLATDSQSRNVEDEFATNNIAVQGMFVEQVEQFAGNSRFGNTILSSDEDDEKSYVELLSERAGDLFVGSLNLSESQAQTLFNAVPASATTQVDVQNSLASMLSSMGLVPDEPKTVTVVRQVEVQQQSTNSQRQRTGNTNVTNVDQKRPRASVTDLAKKSRR